MLEDADKGEINFILAHVNCAFLLEVAAEKTVDILTNPKGRLKDLTTLSRYGNQIMDVKLLEAVIYRNCDNVDVVAMRTSPGVSLDRIF